MHDVCVKAPLYTPKVQIWHGNYNLIFRLENKTNKKLTGKLTSNILQEIKYLCDSNGFSLMMTWFSLVLLLQLIYRLNRFCFIWHWAVRH